MKAPATLDEFYRTFPTERRCWEALHRVRWPDGFRCPTARGGGNGIGRGRISGRLRSEKTG